MESETIRDLLDAYRTDAACGGIWRIIIYGSGAIEQLRNLALSPRHWL
jgi:hypothetical protein